MRREGETDNKLKTKLKEVSTVVETVLPEVHIEGITHKKGMIRKTAHAYNKEFKGDYGQIRDVIILESTWLGYFEPCTTKSIISFAGQMMLNNNQSEIAEENGLLPFDLMSLEPVRTICEKIRGFPWGIVSNGMLINKHRIESLLDAGLRAITVSLDGLEESHNWLRGNSNSFSSALNAVRLLPSIPGIVYDVVTCVNQRNFSELNQIKELLIKAGIGEWRIFTIFPTGRAKDHKELQLNPVNFKGLFDFISQTRKEGEINLNYGCEGFLGNYEQKVRDNFFICRAGINIASILADGSISACPNLRENFIQGNIYKDNFREIWENRYSVFRDKSWTKTGICADCEHYKFCEGNGMHLRDEKTGQLLFCHLKRIEEGEKELSRNIMLKQ